MQSTTPSMEIGLNRRLYFVCTTVLSFFFSTSSWAVTPERLKCKELGIVLIAMESAHYDRQNIAPKIEERAIDEYINSLDSAKPLFLEKEVKSMRRILSGIRRNILKSKKISLLD